VNIVNSSGNYRGYSHFTVSYTIHNRYYTNEEGLLLKTFDFDIGDVYKDFGRGDKVVGVRKYEDAVGSLEPVQLPIAVLKTIGPSERCNTVKTIKKPDVVQQMDEYYAFVPVV